MRFTVQTDCDVLEALGRLFPDSSKSTLRSWLAQGRVSTGGTRLISAKTRLSPGSQLEVSPRATFADDGVKVLYEDGDIVVIDKPAKLLSVALDHGSAKNVHSILKSRAEKPVFPVHRLDRDTSGVLVFAYTILARDHLKKLFAAHSIERVYVALLEGRLEPEKGVWESNLIDTEAYVVKTSPQGKKAVTRYERLNTLGPYSLVRFELETGRKNQIRVHAAEAGYPIVGDVKYGSGSHSRKRLCLHAHLLGFVHPRTGKPLRFTSPVPLFT